LVGEHQSDQQDLSLHSSSSDSSIAGVMSTFEGFWPPTLMSAYWHKADVLLLSSNVRL